MKRYPAAAECRVRRVDGRAHAALVPGLGGGAAEAGLDRGQDRANSIFQSHDVFPLQRLVAW